MQKTLIVCTLLTIIGATRLDFNSADCNKYLGKLGTANNADGSGASKIAFSGEVAFNETSSDVTVNLRYSDADYFNDATFWGLVQEDGKTPETTCLDFKLYKLANIDFSGVVQVTDLTITPSNNIQNQWRYYSFTIKGADLATRLILTANSNNQVYKGYYYIAFYAAETNQLKYTFYFYFTVTVSKATGNIVSTAFKPLSSIEIDCITKLNCDFAPTSEVNWCSDFTCTSIVTTPDLHLNDQFVLQQVITTAGMTGFYLTETEVRYTGYELNKKATIKQIDNATAGSVKVLLNAEIAYRNVTIQVNSVLSNTAGRRLLALATYDTVTGQTSEITCIKAENSDTCPTCQQECDANEFAGDGCDACDVYSSAQIIVSAFIALLLVFIF